MPLSSPWWPEGGRCAGALSVRCRASRPSAYGRRVKETPFVTGNRVVMTALDDFTDAYRYTLFVLGLDELDDVTIAFVDLDQGAFIEMPESIETAEKLIVQGHLEKREIYCSRKDISLSSAYRWTRNYRFWSEIGL